MCGSFVAWGMFLGLGWSQWGGLETSSEAQEVALVVVTEAIDGLLLSPEASLSHHVLGQVLDTTPPGALALSGAPSSSCQHLHTVFSRCQSWRWAAGHCSMSLWSSSLKAEGAETHRGVLTCQRPRSRHPAVRLEGQDRAVCA